MSALWTALHERSHEGLVEDYIKLMESTKAQLAALRTREKALVEALEGAYALTIAWAAHYTIAYWRNDNDPDGFHEEHRKIINACSAALAIPPAGETK